MCHKKIIDNYTCVPRQITYPFISSFGYFYITKDFDCGTIYKLFTKVKTLQPPQKGNKLRNNPLNNIWHATKIDI